ncbi:MAG TPA: sigma-70 family RNA polymerase sigma factor [Anaerolineae bacterium]|nr:sigma-70 family RNA polymerase sigma factor [Anaerolineae bacterium]
MNAEHADDLALARRVATGDEAACALFYERYAALLFAFVHHHLGGSRTDAEDMWQETLLAGVRGIHAYRGQSRLFTWLCSIARFKIADHHRRRGRRPETPFADMPAARVAALMASDPLPDEVVAARGTRAAVVEALGTLNDDYRTALLARYIDGQDVDEVARRLGRSYKATESLLSRAREALRRALAQWEEMR